MSPLLCTLATAAIQSVQFLSKTIDNTQAVPNTVKSVESTFEQWSPSSVKLGRATQSDDSRVVLRDEIKPVVESCDRAYTSFQAVLDRWMGHFTEGKTFWTDRWRVGR